MTTLLTRRTGRLLLVVMFLVAVTSSVLPTLVHSVYSEHGHGHQFPTFVVVLMSLSTPLLFPVLQFKSLVIEYVLPAMGVAHLEGPLTIKVGRWILTPAEPFDAKRTPPAPDYSKDEFWRQRSSRA